MNASQAIKKLKTMKALNDGNEYCMTLNPSTLKWHVAEKTNAQKNIDASDPKLANTKITTWIENYDHSKDLH